MSGMPRDALLCHACAANDVVHIAMLFSRIAWDQDGMESSARHTVWAMPIKDPKHRLASSEALKGYCAVLIGLSDLQPA